ncbi:DEAD/DEAH box helicase [Leucothrix sargassi]|nr:DEAD/DEAH box helicase [Leucothrix sargassi]
MTFATLGLCEALVTAVTEQGYAEPSPIQQEAIPAVLKHRDVVAIARTGTGKTAGFTLPVLQLLAEGEPAKPKHVRALIVAPTRELAAQVAESVDKYSRLMTLRSAVVYGGMRIEPQIEQLEAGVDVLVATPGRLLDLYDREALYFEQLSVLVLDEADRMLDLGFIDDIRRLQTLLPEKRQTLMFSATLSKPIKALVKGMLNKPQHIEISSANSTSENVKQIIHPVDKERKHDVLVHLIAKNRWQQVLVFSKTKRGADELALMLNNAGIRSESIHSNRSQHARTEALAGFKDNSIAVLVATDIASRGIDVNQLPYVVNVDLPFVAEDYVHRIGRTGRAGKTGLAVSLFCEEEYKQLQAIERLIGRKFEREVVPGFEPSVAGLADPSPDEEYGNFEADTQPRRRGKGSGKKRGRSRGRSRSHK